MRALGLALALAGCGSSGAATVSPPPVAGDDGCGLAAAPGVAEHTIEVAGEVRHYLLAIPAGYQPERRHALVFAWHGRSSKPGRAHGAFGIEAAAGGAAIVVYPAGLPVSADPEDTGWDLAPDGIDVALFDALAAAMAARYCVDPRRIFSIGSSFGGYLSSALACYRGGDGAGRVRAIAAIAAGPPPAGCPGAPVAALIINGTVDQVVPLGEGEASRDHWAAAAGCDATTTPVAGVPSCRALDGCAHPVWWCTHDLTETDGHVYPDWSGTAAWALFASLR